MSCLQIVSVHHPGDITAMFAPDLHFLTRTPFSWVKNAEALQKILHLEIFWGFGTRTAPAGGGGSTFPAAGPDGATAGRAGAGPPVGGAQGSGRAAERRRKGAGG